MKIHFIGIGGVAVSGLALLAQKKGDSVQGSDIEKTEITDLLKKRGVRIFIGHKPNLITKDLDLIVFSEAVPKNDPELKKAKKLGLKTSGGAEFLAEIAKDYFLIAVSGMHGKTTTASMAAKVLVDTGLDPSYIIGAKNNWRLGRSRYLIIEADDYKAKLLNYHPDILILTNIEEEHMDCFQNIQHIFKVFRQYARQVKKVVIANKDDKNTVQVLRKLQTTNYKLQTIFYSLKDRVAGELRGKMQVPGEHNVSNALAILKLAQTLKIPRQKALKSLLSYGGVWRRLQEKEIKIKNQKLKIISDYGHHPTEIKASMQAVKEKYPKAKTLLLFQPHQYQRTFYLFDKFIKTFQGLACQKIIITDIYTVKGRESAAIKKKVSAQKLVRAIGKKKLEYLPFQKLPQALKTAKTQFDVIVIMGAGDIYKLADKI